MLTGLSGKPQEQAFLKPLQCQLGELTLTHSFLYMPNCPILLLSGDLLCKLHAQVTFSPEKQQLYLQVPTEHALRLQMLLSGTAGLAEELFHQKSMNK